MADISSSTIPSPPPNWPVFTDNRRTKRIQANFTGDSCGLTAFWQKETWQGAVLVWTAPHISNHYKDHPQEMYDTALSIFLKAIETATTAFRLQPGQYLKKIVIRMPQGDAAVEWGKAFRKALSQAEEEYLRHFNNIKYIPYTPEQAEEYKRIRTDWITFNAN